MTESNESTSITAEVIFHVRGDVMETLLAKAREIDLEENGIEDVEYTLPQALTVVWHAEPEWLHANIIDGWTVERVSDDGTMRDVWPQRVPT